MEKSVQMCGKFQQQKSENLEGYSRAVGMPYIARKMMGMSNPSVEIEETDGLWVIRQSSLIRTSEIKFKLNEEFDENMPGGTLQTSGEVEDNKLIIKSRHLGTGDKVTRTYVFDDQDYDLIILLNHEGSGQVAKRYFKRSS